MTKADFLGLVRPRYLKMTPDASERRIPRDIAALLRR